MTCTTSSLPFLSSLSKICRDTNPLLDTRFWSLLDDILSVKDPTSPIRPTKIWLVPLLNRVSVVPTIVPLLNLLPSLDTKHRQNLIPMICRCYAIIWPLAVQKFGLDALSDCFSATLAVSGFCDADESLAQIGLMITSSFQTFLSNVSNHKKVIFGFSTLS